MAEMVAALDAGLADLRIAGDKGRGLLGPLLFMRGSMLFNEGDYRRALSATEEAVPLLAADPGDEDDWVKAVALRNRLLERVDRIPEALAGADGAIADFARRKGRDDPLTISARLDRVEILVRAGRIPAAREALEKVKTELGGEADPLIAGYYFERLSAIEIAEGHYLPAVEAAEEAIRIRRQSYPDVEALLLPPMRLRASASIGLTDLGYSEQAHRDLVALSERVFPANHPEVARDFNAFAAFLATFRRYGEAEAIERRAVAILKVAYGDGGAKYAFALQNLATFIMFNGKAEEAAGLIRQAIAIASKLPGQDDFLGMARINLASAELTLGRFADALATAKLAETLNAKLPVDAQKRLSSVHGLAMQALAGLKRPEEAIAEGRAMVATLSQDTYEDAANRAIGLTRFAGVLVKSGPAADALSMARAALSATQSLAISAGSDYREPAGIFIGAAWRAGQP
jgi:tetratricopeptide (TPR) repeat protein